ncbi:MAG: DinB family protein [Bacteroidia bacterium]|nr:DinB family protein [Bacteroidia bacterium]
MLNSKEAIIQGAKAGLIQVEEWIYAQDDEKFNMGPKGKWTTAQHLDHLIIVNKQLKKGLGIPKVFLRYKFGKPNRPARAYDTIVSKYKEKLAALPADFTNPSTELSNLAANKQEYLQSYKKSSETFLKKLSKWKDKDLDRYLLPHPLMGRMLVREFMLWSVYHTQHHLKNLKENY